MRDTDATGIVFHPRYLEILTAAREEAVESLGFSQNDLKNQYGSTIVVSKLKMDFFRPAILRQKLVVNTLINSVSSAKLNITQKIFDKVQHDQIILDVQLVLAHINSKTLRPEIFPDEIVKKIQLFS
jgi:acyl-CoA thioester hydrolase